MAKTQYDPDAFRLLKDAALDLRQTFGKRDEQIDAMTDMYMLRDADTEDFGKKAKNAAISYSPDPANAIETAVRLMTANYPGYNVPVEMHKSGEYNSDLLDDLEKAAAQMMRHSDRVRGSPVHVDGARSGLMWDEIIISINSTQALLTEAKAAKIPANITRVERIANVTPYLFDVANPKGCYYDWDQFGLRTFARCVVMTALEIRDKFGSDALRGVKGETQSESGMRTTTHKVWSAWDLVNYACWIEGAGEPLYFEPHGLPTIPWVVHLVEGSRMFDDVKDQRRPFLYVMDKSGMWRNQNLALSAIFTNQSADVLVQYVLKTSDPESRELMIDTTSLLGVLNIGTDEELTQRITQTDPKALAAWQLAQDLGTQSTIYKQVAGQPLGSGATYSETALLNQAGRLPLTAIQRKLAWALGDAVKLAFLCMKHSGGRYKGRDGGAYYNIPAADIPDDLEVEVTLDPTQPQERLQNANIIKALAGEVPREYLYENILHARQPGEMVKQLVREQIQQAVIGLYVQRLAQQEQQPPPEMQMAAESGSPTEGGVGIPSQMMAGGMQGPGVPTYEQQMEAPEETPEAAPR